MMTWEQKLKALAGLSDIRVGLNTAGNFYISLSNCEVSDGGMLGSKAGHGETVEDAVNELWAYFAECNSHVVKAACTDHRRHYKWNGFMWEERPVPVRVKR